MAEKKVRKSKAKKATDNVAVAIEVEKPTEVVDVKVDKPSFIYPKDEIELIIDKDEPECIDVDYSSGCAVRLPPPTSDSVAEYNDFYERHFPDSITKNSGKEPKAIAYAGKKYELDPPLILTAKQKRHYVRVYNKYLKKKRFKKFIQDGIAFHISKEFTGSPETATHRMLPKKTKFEKFKFWLGYQIFSKRKFLTKLHLLPKGVIGQTPWEEVKAIQYALEGRLFENNLNFTGSQSYIEQKVAVL
jgi:hypothetical protein